MNRRLRIGDVVCIRPDAIPDLQREGYRNIKPHVPAKIVDDWAWSVCRVVFQLDMDGVHPSGTKVAVYPGQIRFAVGRAERDRLKTEAHVAKMIAAKAAREKERTRRIGRRGRES